MLLISYDITDNKLRSKLSKYLKKYGRRLQYSVYELDYSKRMIGIIKLEIENTFKKYFSMRDSILIFEIENKNILKYGYLENEEKEILFF